MTEGEARPHSALWSQRDKLVSTPDPLTACRDLE